MVASVSRSVAGVSGEAETSRRWVSPGVRSTCTVSSVAEDTGLVPEPVRPAPAPARPEPTTSVGAPLASTEDSASPLARVPPSRRSSVDAGESGTRSATCFTAL